MITDKLCPLARTFGGETGDLRKTCRGTDCAVYRELPPSASDPSFQAAIKREMACLAQEAGKENTIGYHKKAVANVSKDPESYGVTMERIGYCGLGGKP